mgnify:CR=1 FL=1
MSKFLKKRYDGAINCSSSFISLIFDSNKKQNFLDMIRKVTVEWQGGMSFESDDPSGNTTLMDTHVEGSDELFGVSPKTMMLSALAGCSGIDVVSILNKMKITDYEFSMDIEGELTQEHPKYFHKSMYEI